QCKQCGVRFLDDTLGKKEMEDHLYMHFRQNCKANQSLGHGHSRSWFVDLDVQFPFLLDPKHTNRLSAQPTANKAALAVDAAQHDAELPTLFVVVPSGDKAKPL
ncbi:uncharacterized protein F5891DRAFT_936818, partial [Suillus fuscotomentosus]